MSNQSSAGQKAARAASAAVNIARGAAAGGVYGAAVEAAKSFLPELIRLFVILLCVVLLVPMLVFTALPNILFGYSSSTDQEIIDFTASAQELDGIYQNLDNYQQPAVLRLVNSILPRFWSDGEPLYDDYGVDQDLGYMNKYWLMAIGSVRYKQDLYTMDESAIEDMMYDRLTYSTSLIDRILNIFVRDLTPEEYMDKLKIKAPNIKALCGNLSGGNQQKVILSKWLAAGVKLLILDEPTKGIDVNARAEFYALMNQFVENGGCIIMISSDMPEVIKVADRAYVMSEGHLTGELNREEITELNLISLANPVTDGSDKQ